MNFMVVDKTSLSQAQIMNYLSLMGHTVLCQIENLDNLIETYSCFMPEFIIINFDLLVLKDHCQLHKVVELNNNVKIIAVSKHISVFENKELLSLNKISIVQHPITLPRLKYAIDSFYT